MVFPYGAGLHAWQGVPYRVSFLPPLGPVFNNFCLPTLLLQKDMCLPLSSHKCQSIHCSLHDRKVVKDVGALTKVSLHPRTLMGNLPEPQRCLEAKPVRFPFMSTETLKLGESSFHWILPAPLVRFTDCLHRVFENSVPQK